MMHPKDPEQDPNLMEPAIEPAEDADDHPRKVAWKRWNELKVNDTRS